MRYLAKTPEWISNLRRDLDRLARTGFCGTCVDCPGGPDARPDLCVNRERYDHKITPRSALEHALLCMKAKQ